MTPKSWYASKTVWFNVLTVVFAIASAHGWTPNAELAESISVFILAVSPIVNLLLRFITKQPIGSSN
jgi:cytochrome bd-type quinol oxidase subunit 1